MLFRSRVSDRQQFVKLGDHSSTATQCASGVPQGSVLGPLLFTAYVSTVGELIESRGVSYHQFADDTQLLVAMNVTDAGPALEKLANCSTAVRLWFLHNDLQLNAHKSEVVILGTAPQLLIFCPFNIIPIKYSTFRPGTVDQTYTNSLKLNNLDPTQHNPTQPNPSHELTQPMDNPGIHLWPFYCCSKTKLLCILIPQMKFLSVL